LTKPSPVWGASNLCKLVVSEQMIYTLTPNPSVDRSLTLAEIRFNTVLRTQGLRLDWGGKGFNVSRSLQLFGIESVAMGWVGGGTGKMLADGLQKMGIQTDFVWVDQDTRTNTMIIEAEGDWHIKINEPGPPIAADDIEQMFLKVEGYAKKDDCGCFQGSLPPDVPEDFYARLDRVASSTRGAHLPGCQREGASTGMPGRSFHGQTECH
jgi:fructose-1-phosphate kinase PfkB-like protein